MSDKSNKVAYLVVCWNNKDIITECLEALDSQTVENKAVYVLDNASSDETADYVEKNHPDVMLVRSTKNHGFAKGNNVLIKEALQDSKVTHLALINSDAMLHEAWTEEILNGIEGKGFVAGAQGTTLDYYNHMIIDAQHIYIKEDLQAVQYGHGEYYQKEYAYPRRVFGVNAAAAMFTRDFVESQPGKRLFDERFYMYLEDVDVAFRSVMGGWANYYIPTAEAYHMGSVSSKKRSSDYNIYMTYRNQLSMLLKSLPLRTFMKQLPNFLKTEINFYRHLRRNNQHGALKMVVKGRIAGVVRAPLFIGSRLKLFASRKMQSGRLESIIANKGVY